MTPMSCVVAKSGDRSDPAQAGRVMRVEKDDRGNVTHAEVKWDVDGALEWRDAAELTVILAH